MIKYFIQLRKGTSHIHSLKLVNKQHETDMRQLIAATICSIVNGAHAQCGRMVA